MKLISLCIEGTKGAGKSTTIDLLVKELEAIGILTEVFAPFREANEFAVRQGYDGAWPMANASAEANKAEINHILQETDAAKGRAQTRAIKSDKPTIFILDRGWVTLRPHMYEGAWHRSLGTDTQPVDQLWQKILATAPPTFFLYANPAVTKQRRPALDAASGLETDEKILVDYEKRLAIAHAYKEVVVEMFNTGETPQTAVLTNILKYVLTALHLQTPQEKQGHLPTTRMSLD